MFGQENTATDAFTAAPPLMNPTNNQIKVMRLVGSGDAYRDRGRGQPGKAARERTLETLRAAGLLRCTRDGFWRITGRGKEVLLANPIKRKPRAPRV
jgi:hypothetical protein